MTTRKALPRRTVLRGAGGVALGLPLLAAMGREAQAAPPKRLLVFFHHQGMLMDAWKPAGVGTAFTPSPILAPLEPHRRHVTVVSGVANQAYAKINGAGDAHGTAYVSTLTAHTSVDPRDKRTGAAGPSIDQELGRRLQGTARLRALNLSIGQRGKPVYWTGAGQVADRENDPRKAFVRVFGGAAPAKPAAATTRERLLARRKPITDAVRESYRALAARLGGADRETLERHLALVEEAERAQIAPSPPASGAGCKPPDLGVATGTDIERRDLEPQMSRAQALNAVMALACDQTRVVTLTHTLQDFQTFDWLKVDLPGPYKHWHDVIHQRGGSRRQDTVRAMTWYAEQFAFVLQQLASIPEGAGTLLDHTVVLWMSDFGDGSKHLTTSLPIVLAGGAALGLPGGRHLDLTGRTTNDLFTALLQLFGFDDARFGLGELNRGPAPIR